MSETTAEHHLIVVAGPNGSGKSTAAPILLRDGLEVAEFVNADAIAAGLSAFRPESVAIAAGRIMLQRMRALAAARMDFAFETTLASRSFASWISGLKRDGYHVHLLFLWLRSPELALSRVAERVRLGGHDVSADVVRRRYDRGMRNFFDPYQPLADSWEFLDNSSALGPRLIACGQGTTTLNVEDGLAWQKLSEVYGG